MKKAIVFLAEGFEEIEALTPVDVLRRAGIDVRTVAITKNKLVTGARQITVQADALFNDVNYDEVDLIILPGGMPGATNLNAHAPLKDLLIQFSTQQKLIGAICAAPMVLGEMGLLSGKKATCYPGFEQYLKNASVSGEPIETDANITTGKGVGAAMAFSLRLVELLKDKNVASELAKSMLVN